MINDNEIQRDLGWFRVRLGSITGSKVGDLMKSGRKKEQLRINDVDNFKFFKRKC